ncbi:uncharacterized protein LOC114525986 [Dendronephthya gigantea]|uniref:uncharacterized protein LOC114525986 n=1 Tax=Dendronephthya gigantea TaxID=151771 RepID=UPI00106D667D|nr:uncharacterized protein LOC114525986 [Dendronephthya gigantea]
MSGARALLIVLSIFLISKSDASIAQSGSPRTTMETVTEGLQEMAKSTSSAIGGKLAENLLEYFLPSNSFMIMVTNNMKHTHMINPTIYLDNGKTSTPPPFRLLAAQNEGSGKSHLVIFHEGPKGVLCYHGVSNEYKLKEALCVLFDATNGKYSVVRERNKSYSTKKEAKKLFKKTSIQAHKGGFLFESNTYTQITTGANKQLYFEVLDNPLMDDIATPEKRELFTLGMLGASFGIGIVKTLGSYITNKLIKGVGKTLTIENVSSNPSIVLKSPRWVKNGVNILDIIPRSLSSKMSCEVKLEAPFLGGDSFAGHFKKSFIVLSFLIDGTNYRLILLLSNKLNSHTVFLDETPKVEKELDYHLKKFREPVNARSVVETEEFQSHTFWHFPILDADKENVEKFVHVVTSLGNADNSAMTMKVYATNAPGDVSPPSGNDMVLPKVYSGQPDEIIPEVEEE